MTGILLPLANNRGGAALIRRITIYSNASDAASGPDLRLADLTVDDCWGLGVPLGNQGQQIAALMDSETIGYGWEEASPLRFGLDGPTLVVLRLWGSGWQFASANAAVTTAVAQGVNPKFTDIVGHAPSPASRYDVVSVPPGDACSCVSFMAMGVGGQTVEQFELELNIELTSGLARGSLMMPLGVDDPGKKPPGPSLVMRPKGVDDPGKKPNKIINNYGTLNWQSGS